MGAFQAGKPVNWEFLRLYVCPKAFGDVLGFYELSELHDRNGVLIQSE